ncbi:response regulator [Spirosoma spitsbergense]|uniref:response regulator n=1 Tax=Spirosoma spitsbergense TaxID=431554 RepID=UPI000375B8C8|nr:response regulator [Spirosoma spitsbergense]
MRLDYNILWIEDDHEWLDTTKKLFEESVDDLGFRLNPTSFKDGDKIDELVIQNGFADFDLILVDFNLQNSQTGNTIIEKLRESEIYTDVLFYSQDIDNVRSSVKDLGLEGVYTSGRDGIEDKFEKVVKTTIKKIKKLIQCVA